MGYLPYLLVQDCFHQPYHLTFSKCVIFFKRCILAAQPSYHIYRTFPTPKKIGYTTVSHTFFLASLRGFLHDHGVGETFLASQHINADDAAGVGPCVVQLHLSFRWRLDRACARIRWIRESVLLVKKRKKVGKGGSIQKQPGELIGGVNCYPLTRRRGKNHGNNLSTKTSDEKPVHFWLFCFFPGKLFV